MAVMMRLLRREMSIPRFSPKVVQQKLRQLEITRNSFNSVNLLSTAKLDQSGAMKLNISMASLHDTSMRSHASSENNLVTSTGRARSSRDVDHDRTPTNSITHEQNSGSQVNLSASVANEDEYDTTEYDDFVNPKKSSNVI